MCVLLLALDGTPGTECHLCTVNGARVAARDGATAYLVQYLPSSSVTAESGNKHGVSSVRRHRQPSAAITTSERGTELDLSPGCPCRFVSSRHNSTLAPWFHLLSRSTRHEFFNRMFNHIQSLHSNHPSSFFSSLQSILCLTPSPSTTEAPRPLSSHCRADDNPSGALSTLVATGPESSAPPSFQHPVRASNPSKNHPHAKRLATLPCKQLRAPVLILDCPPP